MKFLSLVFIAFLLSCGSSHKFSKYKNLFEHSKVLYSYKAVADMNGSYFEIRENNLFQFYRQLFDSVKNTVYPGTYVLQNDTFYLKFFDKKGEQILGKKAIRREDDIIFY